ncbi:AbrB family transcriptional regulator [Azospirillum sp. B4]|uniref:AbrB family transcriptional regulator n=1 Tax=Azospirillum sp. B4 TaxID=95605 RepID=UPI0020790519|nr:AbrB family transcriptional regulator [Azospirillum sp. B4]
MPRDLSPDQPPGVRHLPSLGQRPAPVQWGVLLALSAALVAMLEVLHLPAALLLGPMLAGIIVAGCEGTVRVPRLPFLLAQGVVGCMVARSLTPAMLQEMVARWPLFLLGVLWTLAASAGLGWWLARRQVLPGTTAVWGSSPGGATAMVLMAGSYGADMRLVAFMQYLRVVIVAAVASTVARLWGVPAGAMAPAVNWFPALAWGPFAATLALVVLGVGLSRVLGLTVGPLLLPMGMAILARDTGLFTPSLPPWLLALSYALVGWAIGLRFTRPILAHAARALPRVLGAILALIGLCGVCAFLLTRLAGLDPLTAYLATSPGGADSVAIIAASTPVDAAFVMAMQTVRFLLVLITGPRLAQFMARRLGTRLDPATPETGGTA